MSECNLYQKKCIPCEGGIPKLTPQQVSDLLKQARWLASKFC